MLETFLQNGNGTAYAATFKRLRILRRSLFMPNAKLESDLMEEFDTEFLLHAPEIYIFSACRHLVELIKALGLTAADRTKSSPEAERLNRLLAQLGALAVATERFDIIVPFTPESGFSPFFWRWFNWWWDYRQKLTREELDEVHQLQDCHDPAVIKCRPRGNWVTYRNTPAIGLSTTPLVKPSRSRSRSKAKGTA